MKKVLILLFILALIFTGCSNTNSDYETRLSSLESANSDLVKQIEALADQLNDTEPPSAFKILEDFDFFTSVKYDENDSKPLDFSISLLGANTDKYFFEFELVMMDGQSKLYFPSVISTEKSGEAIVVNLEIGDKKMYNGDTGEAESVSNLKDDIKNSQEVVLRIYNMENGQTAVHRSTKVND